MYVRGQGGGTIERLKEVKSYENIDILFLGASHTYREFDPRIFAKHNIKTFNLGSSIQTPTQTEILLNKYLPKLNPKLVIYEVYPNVFMKDDVESALDIICNDDIDIHSLTMAFKANNILVYNTLLYNTFAQITNQRHPISKEINTDEVYVNGGYVERKLKFYKNNDTIKTKEWKPLVYNIKAFNNTLKKLKERNIKTILVYAPTTKRDYKSFTKNKEIDSFFTSKAEYYNFNNILNLNDTLNFYDYNHLNQTGVEIFNNKLIELLDLENKLKNIN